MTKAKTQFLRGRAPACLAAFFTLLATLFPAAGKCGAAASSRLVQQESEQLVHGQKIEREWSGDAPRFYRLRVAAGQYLNLSFGVLEGKVWLKLALLAPDGTRTKGHDRYYVGQNFEPAVPAFITIAPVAGDYLLEVSLVTKKDFTALPGDATATGRYVLAVNDLRPATERDRLRVEAWHTFWRAHLTYQQSTAESQVASKDLYLRSIGLFRQLGDARRELEANYLLANIYNSLGEYESAVEASRQAIVLARAAGEREREANALMYLAESLAYLNDYARTIETLRQALPLWQSLGRENSWGVGWALNALARAHRALGERRQAAE